MQQVDPYPWDGQDISAVESEEIELAKRATPRRMQLVTHLDYLGFLKEHNKVTIEEVEVALHGKWSPQALAPPLEFRPEVTNVWSFPDRGSWATHNGSYRGNWSPYIPRNILLKYSEPGQTVLDQMVGGGTTLVECKLLGRNAIGVDINPDAIMVTRDRLNFSYAPLVEGWKEPDIATYIGDARALNKIPDSTVDLIATHPPYANIIPYNKKLDGDISKVRGIGNFIGEISRVAEECRRVLKPGKHCAILIGDTRRHQHFVPIAIRVMKAFLDTGFIIREDIVKVQWNMKSTREKWRGGNYGFYLLGYEHLYVFRKPEAGETLSQFKESMKWT